MTEPLVLIPFNGALLALTPKDLAAARQRADNLGLDPTLIGIGQPAPRLCRSAGIGHSIPARFAHSQFVQAVTHRHFYGWVTDSGAYRPTNHLRPRLEAQP